MSASPPSSPNRLPRLLSLVIALLGVVLIIVGIVVYGFTSAQLRGQGITVATLDANNPGSQAGKAVAGPITINAQVKAIEHHVSLATGGKTFGQMKGVSNDGKTFSADIKAGVCSAADPGGAKGDPLTPDCAKYYSARITAQQGAWTVASMMLPMLAFGVAAFIAGMGLVVFLIGGALYLGLKPKTVAELKE